MTKQTTRFSSAVRTNISFGAVLREQLENAREHLRHKTEPWMARRSGRGKSQAAHECTGKRNRSRTRPRERVVACYNRRLRARANGQVAAKFGK